MNLTSYSITAYLVILLIFGVLDIFFAAYLKAKSTRRAYARKMLLRGCAWLILSLSFLGLLRRGIVGPLMAFITVGVLVLVNEYLLIWIEKVLSAKDRTQVPSTLQKTWSATRARGKRRFLLISIASYGFGALWLAIMSKIILLESFPIYLVPILMIGGTLWGYFDGAEEWKRNERQYLKLKDASHDAG